MWILLIVAVIVSVACDTVVARATDQLVLTEESRRVVRVATVISIAMGIVVYQAASFGIELYDSNDLDFWDYGDITSEGILYITMKIVGMLIIAETAINTAFIALKDMRDTLAICEAKDPHRHIEKNTPTEKMDTMSRSSPMPQNYVPAWKQVELENREKEN